MGALSTGLSWLLISSSRSFDYFFFLALLLLPGSLSCILACNLPLSFNFFAVVFLLSNLCKKKEVRLQLTEFSGPYPV